MDSTDKPIVVVEGGDLAFFSSTAAAEDYLEAIDVEEGVYWAFDADGLPLRLCVVDVVEKGLFRFGHVRVSRVRIENDIAELGVQNAREALVAFLKEVDPHASIDPATPIREIIQAAARKYGVC